MTRESKTDEEPQADSAASGMRDSTLAVAQSVLAAAFGVQSSKNRERDFSEAGVGKFIFSGLVFCALFAGTLVTLVYWITRP